ncbi:uncharacterized protein [Diabrotica undecimpunctata]|uniref:uncharacterized protein n=1 Tax=Diabrotica undecimpunctata TaxID=50387 RepID=UPI003B640117
MRKYKFCYYCVKTIVYPVLIRKVVVSSSLPTMEKGKSVNQKPVKLNLSVILNNKKKREEPTVTSSSDITQMCPDSQTEMQHTSDHDKNEINQIKLNLNISDISGEKTDTSQSFEPVSSSTDGLNQSGSSPRKMLSKIRLSINNGEDIEDFLVFYITPKEEQSTAIKDVLNIIDKLELTRVESKHLWENVFESLQNSDTYVSDKEKIATIHELIKEKYRLALEVDDDQNRYCHASGNQCTNLHCYGRNRSSTTSILNKSDSTPKQESALHPKNVLEDCLLKVGPSLAEYSPITRRSEKLFSTTPLTNTRNTTGTDKSVGFDAIYEHGSERSDTESVGTSNISVLISESDDKTTENSISIYRNKNRKCEDADDRLLEENVNILTNHKTHNLLKKYATQNELINQSSRAVNVCRSYPDFFDPQVIVESEKILLLANIRREAIHNALQRLDIDTEDSITSGTLKIENISFYTKRMNPRAPPQFNSYYVCVVHYGTTVYATKTVQQYFNTIIKFEDIFTFENINSDFEVTVSIYGLQQKMPQHSIWPPKIKGLKLPLPNIVKESFFVLWGTRTIRPCQRHYSIYDLQKTPLDSPIVSTFKANVTTDFVIRVKETGFLTLGIVIQDYIRWEEKWCILEGYKLKYWDSKQDAISRAPEGEINLKSCVSYQLDDDLDEDICPNPTTVCITIKDERDKRKYYFLSTDDLADFEKWTRQINTVFFHLKKWIQGGNRRR